MFIDDKVYVGLLCRLKITPNQFLLCHLLHMHNTLTKEGRDSSAMSELYRYSSIVGKWKTEEIEDIINKGYIDTSNIIAAKKDPALFDITEKFINEVYARENRFDEIWEMFPATIANFNHPSLPRIKLKVCDKDEMDELYNKKVKTKSEHDAVKRILQELIENNQVNFNFNNFIRGEMWKDLDKDLTKHKSNMHVR